MINAVREEKENLLILKLVGTIEESVNFETIVGATPGEVHVNAKEVARINSIGVKSWIKYFSSLEQNGTKLKYFECSPAIVEQVNLSSNFTCGGSVESVYVPFSCGACHGEFVSLYQVEDLKKLGMEIPDIPCPKCQGQASFDDIPEEYFGFLER